MQTIRQNHEFVAARLLKNRAMQRYSRFARFNPAKKPSEKTHAPIDSKPVKIRTTYTHIEFYASRSLLRKRCRLTAGSDRFGRNRNSNSVRIYRILCVAIFFKKVPHNGVFRSIRTRSNSGAIGRSRMQKNIEFGGEFSDFSVVFFAHETERIADRHMFDFV